MRSFLLVLCFEHVCNFVTFSAFIFELSTAIIETTLITKFLVAKLSTSEVISQKPQARAGCSPPPPRAFRANTSFLKFGDTIYCKTPSNTFVLNYNYNKPISATQCLVETNDIMIDPIPEYFNHNISPCHGNVCLTYNSFIRLIYK